MIFRKEGLIKKLLEERMKKGPILRKLREEFFKSATKVLDADQFFVALREDIKNAKELIVIISPFLSEYNVNKFVSYSEVKDALKRGVRIIVVTRAPEKFYYEEEAKKQKSCIEILEKNGLKVVPVVEPTLHFKAVIIDNAIIYIGSINVLSIVTTREIPADYMLRFESEALVDEIIANAIGEDIYSKWLEE